MGDEETGSVLSGGELCAGNEVCHLCKLVIPWPDPG